MKWVILAIEEKQDPLTLPTERSYQKTLPGSVGSAGYEYQLR